MHLTIHSLFHYLPYIFGLCIGGHPDKTEIPHPITGYSMLGNVYRKTIGTAAQALFVFRFDLFINENLICTCQGDGSLTHSSKCAFLTLSFLPLTTNSFRWRKDKPPAELSHPKTGGFGYHLLATPKNIFQLLLHLR